MCVFSYSQTDCCDDADRRNCPNSEDETNTVNLRGNSLPASPVKSSTSYITPPPLYCDTRLVVERLSFGHASSTTAKCRGRRLCFPPPTLATEPGFYF